MGKNAKDKRDVYYRLAKQLGYRSRSAFKLLQIESFFKVFEQLDPEDLIIDLCSAPGGWSQVCTNSMRMIKNSKHMGQEEDLSAETEEFKYVVAIDIQKMDPIQGVEFIQGDITNQCTLEELKAYSNNRKIKMVICDGAPDITGLTEFDLHIQSQLIYCALNFAVKVLSDGGIFITKMYKGKCTAETLQTLSLFFNKVTIAKPKACRNASYEAFITCEGFCFDKYLAFQEQLKSSLSKLVFIDESIDDTAQRLSLYSKINISKQKLAFNDMQFFNSYHQMATLLQKLQTNSKEEQLSLSLSQIGIEFIQVGKENYDSDKTYNFESTGYSSTLNPVQMPIDPPYKMYCSNLKGKAEHIKKQNK